jgi:hypothetical protein
VGFLINIFFILFSFAIHFAKLLFFYFISQLLEANRLRVRLLQASQSSSKASTEIGNIIGQICNNLLLVRPGEVLFPGGSEFQVNAKLTTEGGASLGATGGTKVRLLLYGPSQRFLESLPEGSPVPMSARERMDAFRQHGLGRSKDYKANARRLRDFVQGY